MKRRTLAARLLVATLPVLLTVPILWLAAETVERWRKEAVGRELLAVARTGAQTVDGDAFAGLFHPDGASEMSDAELERHFQEAPQTADFRRLADGLSRIIEANRDLDFTHDNVYTFATSPLNDSADLRWAVMTHDQPFSGEPYAARTEMFPVLDGESDGAFTDVYRSAASDHDWISAYAPIRTGAGEVVGILEVAWPVELVLAELAADIRRGLSISGAILLLALAAAALLTTMTMRLERRTVELQAALDELHSTQETLIRTEKLAAVGQLAASVGHELRNPLAAVRNATTYISRKLAHAPTEDPRIPQFLDVIEREVGNCTRIISDLLDFARERPPARELCPLHSLVEEVATVVPTRSDRVRNEVPEHLPAPWVDRAQLRQVLTNLVQNGLEALPSDTEGWVTVRARMDGPTWVLEVEDEGSGMPAETREKVFEPLFTTKTKGTGLGLAIVANLIRSHGGTIAVDSKLDRGTRFTIRLPPADSEPPTKTLELTHAHLAG